MKDYDFQWHRYHRLAFLETGLVTNSAWTFMRAEHQAIWSYAIPPSYNNLTIWVSKAVGRDSYTYVTHVQAVVAKYCVSLCTLGFEF